MAGSERLSPLLLVVYAARQMRRPETDNSLPFQTMTEKYSGIERVMVVKGGWEVGANV